MVGYQISTSATAVIKSVVEWCQKRKLNVTPPARKFVASLDQFNCQHFLFVRFLTNLSIPTCTGGVFCYQL